MALKSGSQNLLLAANIMGRWRLEDPQDVNFLQFFWHFLNPYIKWNHKMPQEQRKVKKKIAK